MDSVFVMVIVVVFVEDGVIVNVLVALPTGEVTVT